MSVDDTGHVIRPAQPRLRALPEPRTLADVLTLIPVATGLLHDAATSEEFSNAGESVIEALEDVGTLLSSVVSNFRLARKEV